MPKSRFLKIVCGVIFVGAAGFLYGVAFGKFHVFPYDVISSFLPDSKDRGDRYRIDTALVRLDVTEYDASRMVAPGPGGGITSMGDFALMVTHRGDVLQFDGTKLSPTAIKLPDNGYDQYIAKAETKFIGYNHKYQWLRYNDILFFDDGAHAGLAISYIQWNDALECYRGVVAVTPLAPGTASPEGMALSPADWKTIFETSPCLKMTRKRALDGHMLGGRMAYMGNGYILVTTGEAHRSTFSQRDDVDLGRVNRIAIDGSSVHAVNKGLRNPLGITLDSKGRLWTVENGPTGGDELNLIKEGHNYGWPISTYGTERTKPINGAEPPGRHDRFEAPVYAWVPSVAPSNLIEVRNFDPAWQGDLLVASLRGQSLFRIRLKDDRVAYVEAIKIGARLRYVHEHTDGRLLVWTDDARLVVLSARPKVDERPAIEMAMQRAALSDEAQSRATEVLETCIECHSVHQGISRNAPSLAGVVGRPVAAMDYEDYSSALRSVNGKWTRERLKDFLRDPDDFAPGTGMPAQAAMDEETLDALIAVLENLPEDPDEN